MSFVNTIGMTTQNSSPAGVVAKSLAGQKQTCVIIATSLPTLKNFIVKKGISHGLPKRAPHAGRKALVKKERRILTLSNIRKGQVSSLPQKGEGNMTPRERVLRALKIYQGSFGERLEKVRDSYAHFCASCLAAGLVESARDYAYMFQYCNSLLSTLWKRWKAINIPEQN
jgi:hypothetical protein